MSNKRTDQKLGSGAAPQHMHDLRGSQGIPVIPACQDCRPRGLTFSNVSIAGLRQMSTGLDICSAEWRPGREEWNHICHGQTHSQVSTVTLLA